MVTTYVRFFISINLNGNIFLAKLTSLQGYKEKSLTQTVQGVASDAFIFAILFAIK